MLEELGSGSHYSPGFAIELTAGNKQVLQSLELQRMLSKILVLCQSVDT